MIYGSRNNADGTDYMFASESVALESAGYSNFKDVGPGEVVIVSKNGIKIKKCSEDREFTPCVFEYVYFSRPDSIIDGVSVYQARSEMGDALALTIENQIGKQNDIDVVIPV